MQRTLHLIISLLIAGALVLSAASPAMAAGVDSFVSAMDQAVPELLTAYHVPGVAVAYIQDGEVVWSNGYGLADKPSRAPMTDAHILAHGSDGKVITTWAVLRLVDEGKVDLDAPAQQYLKRWQFPASAFDASRITVRMLLTHTSGLEPAGYLVRDPRFPLVTIVDSLNGRNYGSGPVRITSEPGRRFSYSGASFAVAQLLVEDVTGESFEAYTQRIIFQPLGMDSAAWHWTPELIARAATPYGTAGEALPFYDLSEAGAGGEMMSAGDFARFVAAAVPGPDGEPAGRGILMPETVAQAITEQPGGNGTAGLGYGIGHLKNGERYVMHLGGDPGWRAVFALQPETRDGFVAVANSDRGDKLMLELMDIWARATHGTTLPLVANWNRTFQDEYRPMRVILTTVALCLGLIAVVGALRLSMQVRLGTRHLEWSSGSVPKLAVVTFGLAAWVIFFHTRVPIPWPPAWLYIHWTREIGLVTASVAALACLGAVSAVSSRQGD